MDDKGNDGGMVAWIKLFCEMHRNVWWINKFKIKPIYDYEF